MFAAFVRNPDGVIEAFDSVSALGKRFPLGEAEVWVDLESPAKAELEEIGRLFELDAEALDDCLSGEQRPRIDEYDAYGFVVLYGAIGPESTETFDPRKLGMFCGKSFLLTVHSEPLRTLNTLRDRARRNQGRLLEGGIGGMFLHTVDMIVDNFVVMADGYEERIEALEESSLCSDVGDTVLESMLELRRDLVHVRRVAASQREILNAIVSGDFDYISADLGRDFKHVRDHLTKVVEMIDAQRERLTAVRDNYHTALAARTNEIMKTLTAFASILLPLSVVAGIYGMNLKIWPSERQAYGFWVVLAGMAVLGYAALLYFRRRKWL
jgi:magnesium transporter